MANQTGSQQERGFETRAIHAGQEPDASTGAVMTPIYQTSTYAQEEVGKHKGFEYSRTSNPTRVALEKCISDLEAGSRGFAFSSGMAAITTLLLSTLRPGDHVLLGNDVYGGTYRLLSGCLSKYGLSYSLVNLADEKEVLSMIRPETRMVWLETPSNPRMRVVDIAHLAELARSRELWLAVDNTFASPYLQRPLELGAHFVVHSATKYLGGHSDVVLGAVVTSEPEAADSVQFDQNAIGAVPGPMDCFLVLRGLKTLAIRMKEHSANAQLVAEFLERHPKVETVYFPGLPSHPDYDLARTQMALPGGMLSFEIVGGLAEALRFVKSTKLFTLAESLGGVESLIEHPQSMTHASLAGSTIEVPPSLVRLSVGIENADDLIADLENAFQHSA